MSTEKLYNIPIISRGRIIEPGDDAIEFGGRTGARFRCPNPARHVSDLLLRDGSALGDLAALSTDEILDFLAELGPRLALDRNPWMQEAFELCLAAGGLTEPVLRPVYQGIVKLFERERLAPSIDAKVGKDYLDGWVEQGKPGRSRTRIRAFGTRQVHITAGNVPVVAALTVINTALTKGDSLIKLPSNDPLTACAIVRTMIEMAPDHPVTRHFAVAYWKGGDEVLERQLFHPSAIQRITAWGGMSSMTHIQKYLVPGIELIPMNPKLSISIVGKEAFDSAENTKSVATGVALMAGRMNQTACSSTRIVYVESDLSDDSLDQLEALGREIYEAFQTLPEYESTPAKAPNPELEAELEALSLDDTFYRVIGDTIRGGAVVSRVSEPVEFADDLNNRIVNLVPVEDIHEVCQWVSEETQTVGIYPETLRQSMRDELALNGVQRTIPLGESLLKTGLEDPGEQARMPHDGGEPLRRMVRWIVDQSAAPEL